MDFNDVAAHWDDKPERAERATAVAASIRAALPLRPTMTAIELGGGTGLLSRALADDLGMVTVTDVAPGMVTVASQVLADPRYAGWTAQRYDVDHDPLPEQRFHLVLSQLALHHVADPGTTIRTAFALLVPGGHLALVDLDLDPDGHFHAATNPDFEGPHGFDRAEVRGWLIEAGFVDVELSTAYRESKIVDGVERHLPLFLATGRRPDQG